MFSIREASIHRYFGEALFNTEMTMYQQIQDMFTLNA